MDDLASNSIDCIVTDPPYNLNYGGRGKINKHDNFENDNLATDEWVSWMGEVMVTLERVLKENKAIYVFIDYRMYPSLWAIMAKHFDIKNCIVWYKNSFGMGQHYRYQHELCIYAIKGKHKLNTKAVSDVWISKKETTSEYLHPTQKPINLMLKPILYSTQEGEIVLDPFAGSGSTLVAAKKLKRRYLGIEIDEKYYNITKERLRQDILF